MLAPSFTGGRRWPCRRLRLQQMRHRVRIAIKCDRVPEAPQGGVPARVQEDIVEPHVPVYHIAVM